jgi:Polyketide cyclase / dehydrase and lipid transport
MVDLVVSDSITISRSPDDLFDMVSDVSRMGEWSPVCKECWWDEGESLSVGAWFTGRNETTDRTWETRSEVAAADKGREFAFIVGGTWTRWSYTFAPTDGGTIVTETWEFLPGGITRFEERFGDDAWNQIDDRRSMAQRGIPATLAALKRVAES